MAKARKRGPGAGRKAKGMFRGKREWFTTRITPETRQALERKAAASGRSISQVAEELLTGGIKAEQWRDEHRALRALCFVIERIALEATGGRWMTPADPIFKKSSDHAKVGARLFIEWRTDPFRYRAFRLAVASLLTALEPKGEIRSPHDTEDIDIVTANDPAIKELMKRTYESPENFGAYIFSNMWRELTRSYPLTERENYHMDYGRNPVGAAMLADFYQMADARHDLGLDAKPEGGKSL
jgi:hypothetical protein